MFEVYLYSVFLFMNWINIHICTYFLYSFILFIYECKTDRLFLFNKGESSGEQLQHQENQALPAAQPSQVDNHGSSAHEQAVHTEPVVSSGKFYVPIKDRTYR